MLQTSSGEKFVVFRLGEKIRDVQKQCFMLAYENNYGNTSAVARTLGISRKTAFNWQKSIAFGGDEDCTDPADLIPGDNDKQGDPVTPTPGNVPLPNCPDNLVHIPADPTGEVPIVREPLLPSR